MTDLTTPSTASESASHGAENAARPALAVVLACDQPGASAGAAPLPGVERVVLGRGATTCATRVGGELRVELSDRKASASHAEISCRDGLHLRDLGSTNGTFAGAARVAEAAIEPGDFFRVGNTFLSVIADAASAPLPAPAVEPWPFATLHGGFRRDLDRLERVAASSIPILLLGETGTGKEVLAQATHERSGRPGRFIAVNCGALPQALVESLLFGHKKGAFSGAINDEPGFIRQAHTGTLLLDEIGDLPLTAQASLLRVLQEREVTPVGAFQPVRVDVRVLAATHRSLDAMVREGRFRADLHARLAGFVARIPPLRERRCDLGILVARVLGARAAGLRVRPEAALALLMHDYPHNVRELVQALETALVLSKDGVLKLADLPEAMRADRPTAEPQKPRTEALSADDQRIYDELSRRLAESGNNVSQVAREMGKARQQIQRWMRRFGLGPQT